MRHIYYGVALLVLYGDMLKRVLPPSLSLLTLYVLAIGILFAIYTRRRLSSPPMSAEGRVVHVAVTLLILIYLLQLLTSFSSSFMEGLSHAMYMCVPLLYIWVLQRFSLEFDLAELGKAFLLLMIPINLIALVQYFIDPSFLISKAYNSDLGGVILRNFIEGGIFARYPSLFVSADRYSAMGLMQLYFTFIVFKASHAFSGRQNLWLAFNAVSACAALFIAGARSRIIIASVSLFLMALVLLVGAISSRRKLLARRVIVRWSLLLIGVLAFWLVVAPGPSLETSEADSFPMATFFMQSLEKGDLSQRVGDAIKLSLLPEETTAFGQGLGTISEGKPGEFGIKSIWSESGFFWGSLMLGAFLAIVAALSLKVWRSLLEMEPMNVGIYMIPLLLLVFALFAGLTSSFELSTGVLLGCSIAIILRSSANITGGLRLPALLALQRVRH